MGEGVVPDDGLATAPLSVVIVDDEEIIGIELCECMMHHGIRCSHVESISAALDRIKWGRIPDVVVVDLFLPSANGLDLVVPVRNICEALDKQPPGFVVMTGLAEGETVRWAVRLRVDDFLQKPFSHGQIAQAVLRAAGLRRLRILWGEDAVDRHLMLCQGGMPAHELHHALVEVAPADQLRQVHEALISIIDN